MAVSPAAPAQQLALIDLLRESAEYVTLLNGISAGPGEQAVYGLSGSMKTFATAGIAAHLGRPLLIVTTSPPAAERWRDDLRTWLPGREVLVLPPLDVLPLEVVAHSPEVRAARLRVLEALVRAEPTLAPIVVAPIGALLRRLPPAEAFLEVSRPIAVGERVDLAEFLAHLVAIGYERVDLVEGGGQFSLRGAVLDIYPLTAEQPYRIELFDDEVESIRRFDPLSQRSTEHVGEAWIPPAREFFLAGADREAAGAAIRRDLEAAVARLQRAGRAEAAGRLRERVLGHLDRLSEGTGVEGLEHYAPYYHPELSLLHDYLPANLVVVLDEPARLREAGEESSRLAAERQTAWIEQGSALPGHGRLAATWADVLHASVRRAAVSFALLLKQVPGSEPHGIVSVNCKPMQSFHGQWSLFADELGRLKASRYRTVIFVATPERAERLRQSLREHEIERGAAAVLEGSLESGFIWPALRLAVITDTEIYGRAKQRRRLPAPPARGARGAEGEEVRRQRITDYRDLRVGDYVVHVNHGIGRYLGVQTLEVAGAHKDYLTIRYDGEDRLYVPTDQIELVQKYIGAEGHEPRLNRLGGNEWQKVKSRVKESIQKMAIDLLRLQAMRETQSAHAFPPDTPWQREFEEAFKYEETPDQLQAANEIKLDMEKPRPMDRLLCGDVGYGKTEVAIRAIFKAVMDSKQVAVLVPTTILAQQHYNTFRERFAGYPVRIGLLNRFRTPAEQARTLADLERGAVDVVIGTHRLLSEDVRFKDLGLLVVDEEHRFGVGHKERIKQLRANVHVLTLSATPIPRTLHMSLIGLRDMSTIETPPEDRFPVETFVAEQSDALVREAIERELYRGGQVFYVHNRVATIDRAAARVQALVPDARLLVAHGQMREDQLEQVMMSFLDGEADVLCCTTIIESGLDIPSVNTLIVEDADQLGLAQLYQLRGRVGRSNRLAYAYFLYRRDKVLSEVAEKRLNAIREFTEFGSGFKIALRDLEIRGAGNILGPEQHGFIVSVGFDLYCQLLEEAVRELKGERSEPRPEPSIEITVDAYIPDGYIYDPRQKIEAYQKIMAVRTDRDALDLAEEFEDRYGRLPRPVENLLDVARLKAACKEAGVLSIGQQRDRLTLRLAEPAPPEVGRAIQRRLRGRASATAVKSTSLTLRVQNPAEVLSALQDAVAELAASRVPC